MSEVRWLHWRVKRLARQKVLTPLEEREHALSFLQITDCSLPARNSCPQKLQKTALPGSLP
jgi:hypothetical protein